LISDWFLIFNVLFILFFFILHVVEVGGRKGSLLEIGEALELAGVGRGELEGGQMVVERRHNLVNAVLHSCCVCHAMSVRMSTLIMGAFVAQGDDKA
jgi:hypothetical protein